MSINNGSYPFQVLFSSHVCLNSTTGLFVLTAFSVTNVFIHLPLCALIFCLGFQRWRRQKSTFLSHADCFTFNMMAMEMFVLVGLVLSFSSVSVLRVLRRASPGERPGVNVSKRRAFHTITAIFVVLVFGLSAMIVCMFMIKSVEEAGGDQCVVLIVTLWFGLPSSMVLPLLFLHREGKRRQ
ncbi:hypothetical protein NQZ68_018104 [Dissostichus eleginoides]|nr:hypothetical protein NQZ68_018048 [Dissostichus eleginoides]KAI9524421.1 hypothetical protein NQZ68_018104 [Dissostichus eleginoides]